MIADNDSKTEKALVRIEDLHKSVWDMQKQLKEIQNGQKSTWNSLVDIEEQLKKLSNPQN